MSPAMTIFHLRVRHRLWVLAQSLLRLASGGAPCGPQQPPTLTLHPPPGVGGGPLMRSMAAAKAFSAKVNMAAKTAITID